MTELDDPLASHNEAGSSVEAPGDGLSHVGQQFAQTVPAGEDGGAGDDPLESTEESSKVANVTFTEEQTGQMTEEELTEMYD